jgi:hypothetical protein
MARASRRHPGMLYPHRKSNPRRDVTPDGGDRMDGVRPGSPKRLGVTPRTRTRATWRTKPRDSNRRWMKVRWQVTSRRGGGYF